MVFSKLKASTEHYKKVDLVFFLFTPTKEQHSNLNIIFLVFCMENLGAEELIEISLALLFILAILGFIAVLDKHYPEAVYVASETSLLSSLLTQRDDITVELAYSSDTELRVEDSVVYVSVDGSKDAKGIVIGEGSSLKKKEDGVVVIT